MNWVDKPKRGLEVVTVGPCGGYDHLQRDCKAGNDDGGDQIDGPDRKVGYIRNTLVMESDVTS